MKPFPYAIWLMPRAEEGLVLQQAICALSARFGAPQFAPHATLCSGVWNAETSALLDAVESLAAMFAPFEVQTAGIDWTDQWSTFFFLRLQDGAGFVPAEVSMPEGSHRPDVGPHISLLYRVEQGLGRDALRTEMAAQMPSTIWFASLALVRPSDGSWEDVGSWEIMHSARLAE